MHQVMDERLDDTRNLNDIDSELDNDNTCDMTVHQDELQVADSGCVLDVKNPCDNIGSSCSKDSNSNLNITEAILSLHIAELPDMVVAQNETRECKMCWMNEMLPCNDEEEGVCICEENEHNFTICQKCFKLQRTAKLCSCDKTELNNLNCTNCNLLVVKLPAENLCICDHFELNSSICSSCFLLQKNPSPGSKRKPQEGCYGLHLQMNQSEELLQESQSWLSDSNCLFKKPKIPLDTAGALLESIPLDYTDEDGDCMRMLSNSFNNDLELDVKDYEIFDNIHFLNIDEEKSRGNFGDNTSLLCPFDSLPMELKLKIFSYFTQRQLCRYIAPVCSSWFHLSKDISFWQQLHTTRDFDDVRSELLIRVIVSWCKNIVKLELNKREDITITEFREVFQNCPNIQYLSLTFCTQIDNDILNVIGTYCKSLKSINLEGCIHVTDSSFYNFIGLPLTCVNVSHCNMLSDDGGIFLVRNFSNLVEVNFDGIQWMTEDFIKILVDNHYETLEKVFMDGENLGDDSVRQLSRCKHLRALSFSFCNLMTHQSVVWVEQCHKINHLQLRKGSNFTNACLLNYMKNMSVDQGSCFKYLNLAECNELSDKCLFYLSEKCPNLEILDLSWCWEVSDDGLAHIIDNCSKLRELHLKGLHEVYGTPFFHLPQDVPNLSLLDLSQCNKIQDELIKHVVEKMKDLVVYNYYGEVVINARHHDASRYIDD